MHSGRWLILAAMALPAIGEDLGAGTTALQWAVNSFNLALIAPLVAFGRLDDLVGRKRLLLWAWRCSPRARRWGPWSAGR